MMENVYNLLGKVSIARGCLKTSIDSEGSILLAHDSRFSVPAISVARAIMPCVMPARDCVDGQYWSPGQHF